MRLAVAAALAPAPAGAVRDSIARNSEMSEIPFWTVSGVIPCSLL